MGTYINCQLKNIREAHIKECNAELIEMGYKAEKFNGITFGAFTTREQLKEDARFMNKDEEGLKQAVHWPRPIKWTLLQSLIWNHLGMFQVKLSCSEDKYLNNALIVAKWAEEHPSLINWDESSNVNYEIVSEYMSYL